MKPLKFHVGQAVVCVDAHIDGSDEVPSPKKGQVYHIVNPKAWRKRNGWEVTLLEFPHPYPPNFYGYDDFHFAPVELLPDEALAELLAETLEPVTA